jgi:hypothetical protein
MRGEKMKGIFVGTFLVIVIITLVISGAFFVALSTQYINIKISLKSSEVLKATDIVEAVKRGLEIAYNYSFIQAAYEIGKIGGYKDEANVKEWRRYNEINFPSYIASLNERTRKIIENYLKSLDDFQFSNPNVNISLCYYYYKPGAPDILVYCYYENQESKIDRRFELSEAKMLVYFLKPLNYSKYFFSIYENPNRTISLPLEYFKLYDVSHNLFIGKDSVKAAIEDAEKELEKSCKESQPKDVCENKKEQPKIDENCKNTFKNKVLQKIEGIKSNDKDVEVKLTTEKIEIKVDSLEKYDKYEGNSKDCDCKEIEWNQVDNGATPCDNFCSSNGYQYSKFENNKCYCGNCKEYYGKYINFRYEYKYLAAVKVLCSATTKTQYYIYYKYEGNLKLRNLNLTFNLTTSNDYSWQPI